MRLSPPPVPMAMSFVLLLLGWVDGGCVLDGVGEVEIKEVEDVTDAGVEGPGSGVESGVSPAGGSGCDGDAKVGIILGVEVVPGLEVELGDDDPKEL
jgi:hypothetical protein